MNVFTKIAKIVIRFVLRVLYVLPLQKNRIVFESFSGTQISCNPYYIYKKLCTCGKCLDLIWVMTSVNVPQGIKTVKKNSLQYLYTLLTAKVYVTNNGPAIYIPFRKSQIVINTWHGGGAYKKCQISDRLGYIRAKITASMTTYLLSSSEAFTQYFASSILIPESKCINTGMPRNDVFFNQRESTLCSEKVNATLNIPIGAFVILYAPTFRGNEHPAFDFILDVSMLVEAIKNRFGQKEIMILFRCHYFLSQDYTSSSSDSHVVNVSNYPNMQELLCRADVLISDYSSSIWDFSFTYRPCFLFTPDLEEYQVQRNFYISINEWGFPIARTNAELKRLIENFDEANYKQAMNRHHQMLGSYESGNASEQTVQLILETIE